MMVQRLCDPSTSTGMPRIASNIRSKEKDVEQSFLLSLVREHGPVKTLI